jgi:hypothetical protein
VEKLLGILRFWSIFKMKFLRVFWLFSCWFLCCWEIPWKIFVWRRKTSVENYFNFETKAKYKGKFEEILLEIPKKSNLK